jgi:hypothetical protein
MSGHIFLAIVAAIALSAPAWAGDPAEAPIDTERRAILLDPAEAPIDTEMKIILWLETIEAPLRAHMPLIEVSTWPHAANPCSPDRASLPLIAGVARAAARCGSRQARPGRSAQMTARPCDQV